MRLNRYTRNRQLLAGARKCKCNSCSRYLELKRDGARRNGSDIEVQWYRGAALEDVYEVVVRTVLSMLWLTMRSDRKLRLVSRKM